MKSTLFIGFRSLLFQFSSFFCFSCSNIRRQKQTNKAIFFSKTSVLTSQHICENTIWHKLTLFVFCEHAQKHYNMGKNSEIKTWTSF